MKSEFDIRERLHHPTNPTEPKTIDLSFSWRQALPYILLLLESHAKKSYKDFGADDHLKTALTDLIEQHETLAEFYLTHKNEVK